MNILLGVTGSISAYKALDLCRGLTKASHNVRVILTRGACEFVQQNAFHYLGAEKVYSSQDDFSLNQYESSTRVLHIDLVKWCDKLIIAPASANTVSKLSHGLCDDLLSSTFLALGEKPCLIFPAMNTQMLKHSIIQENLQRLESLQNVFIHPTKTGELACGDIGAGKLPDVDLLIEMCPVISLTKTKKVVLITTGATISPLDPVRFLTNPSSGKTGFEFAKTYLKNGYKVVLIYGHNSDPRIQYFKHVPNIETIQAITTNQMKDSVHKYFDSCDLYISTAAMSDIEFPISKHKIKKSSMNKTLNFTTAPDVLASVLEKKKHQKIIGFAAETNATSEVFLEKWNRKPVDLLIGNIVNNGTTDNPSGFGIDENKYFFIKDGKVQETKLLTKTALSEYVIREIHD